jgi:NADPH:quinone reductase-like Zn-dependent oxidoreductase
MIVGGGGSVAHYAIQFAKMRGAHVITTVSGPEKAAHARSAGADEVINYRTENVGQRVKTSFFLIDINFKVERALYFEVPDALLVVAG